MTNPIIKIIVKLFSIFTNLDYRTDSASVIPLLRSYLSHYAKDEQIQEFLSMYTFFNSQYSSKSTKDFYKEISLKSVKTLQLIDQINKSLVYTDKIFLLSHLAELLKIKDEILEDEQDFLFTIALSFNIPDDEFKNLRSFVLDAFDEVPDKDKLLIAGNLDSIQPLPPEIKILIRESLTGKICFLHIPSANLFLFYYSGYDVLFLNDRAIRPNKIYKFSKGNSISSYKMGLQDVRLKPIYYTELAHQFITKAPQEHINLVLDQVSFSYKKNSQGIRPFYFETTSFLFVGVIGSSGVGKSTLLNIINGNLRPQDGKVLLNGWDVHRHKEVLRGLIGYVPQDDLLFEELTVYQNLYYNAKLCFGNYSETELHEKVQFILDELDLSEIKDAKVGTPLEKEISGGQRKRINLGLELLREPALLLVDEPTSGLSSSDSLNIMNLLREQTLKGKLVIVNIHQPSSNIFRLFDQLIVLDDGGTPVYTGDPMDGLVYFKTIDEQVNAQEKECPACGSINPEIMLEIIEDKEVDEQGRYTGKRKRTPDEWYQKYKENTGEAAMNVPEKKELPSDSFKKPNLLKQFRIYFSRNLLTKLSNKQYLLISLLEAPLLALILGYFTKYTAGTEETPYAYLFIKNLNLPSYLLMSIIVALFIGMLISAEEIIRDRKVLEREKFLNLSRSGYLLSKIALLTVISAFQMFTFVMIGNSILEIKGLNTEYWIVLFSVAVFANLLGLNISAGLKSAIAIYVLIPFLLIPQILLSGTIVQFDKLHQRLTTELYPPFVADLMTSRWAYEALAVTQFKENEYRKHFFAIEKKESDYFYKSNILIPKLGEYLDYIENDLENDKPGKQSEHRWSILKNELRKLEKQYQQAPGKIDYAELTDIKPHELNHINNFLQKMRVLFAKRLDNILYEKDEIINTLISRKGGLEAFNQFKNRYDNTSIAELVKRKDNPVKIIEKNHQLYRKTEPIYFEPVKNNGRAQFYCAEKKIGKFSVKTLFFNVLIIWIFNIVLYIVLYFNIVNKMITVFNKRKR